MRQLLWDETKYPNDSILEGALGDVFSIYQDFLAIIQTQDHRLTPEWRYYRDGKAWLCKVTDKKKTILWLSIWEGSFKTSFYFTEKTGCGIHELDIDEKIKIDFKSNAGIGRLRPLVLDISERAQLKNLLALVEYKRRLK
jgi:hypothetical protein